MEPQVKRIGKYKSAGDQLLLKDMSEPQREQLTALLEDIYEGFTSTIAHDRKKTVAEVSFAISCQAGSILYCWLIADATACVHTSSSLCHAELKSATFIC